MIKIINPHKIRFKVGDNVLYNYKAIVWMNSNIVNMSLQSKRPVGIRFWNSARELNSKKPKIFFMHIHQLWKKVEIWVSYWDNKSTGLSTIVDFTSNSDIWFLDLDGTYGKCPYVLFIKNRE